MSKKLELTLACGPYESVRALQDGTVTAGGLAPRPLPEHI